jgi:uncharacterized protein (TIGR00255 family)
MKSMTGFGSASAPLSSALLTVELRSVNHKHQDLRLRLPAELVDHSSYFEQQARSQLGRGRFDVSVRLSGAAVTYLELDAPRLRIAFAALTRLRDELAPGTPLELSSLLALPDIYRSVGPEASTVQAALLEALTLAALQLDKMRVLEGQNLKDELQARLALCEEKVLELGERSAGFSERHRDRLSARLEALLSGSAGINPDRLEQEVALAADRSDITEEVVRLKSHFSQLSALLHSSDPAGRRLDFLLQEVGREVNTIGSKCQDSQVAHLVIDLKSEVERLREQVQNVE